MRASGPLVVLALVGASGALTLAGGACSYSSTGQGGPAGAIYDGGSSVNGGSSGGGSGPGNGSGGAYGSSGGAPGGNDASVAPGCGGDNDCGGGICCGTLCCAGSNCCGDGTECCENTPPTCSSGETVCPGGAGCCAAAADAAPPPVQCGAEPPNFDQACVTYYGGKSQGGACSACLAGAALNCGKQANCSVTSCEQTCDAQYGCPEGCNTDAYCECIYQCQSPNTSSDACCGPQTMSLYTCAVGPCASVCMARPDAGIGEP